MLGTTRSRFAFAVLAALCALAPRDAQAIWPPQPDDSPEVVSRPENFPNDPDYAPAEGRRGQWQFWSWVPGAALALPTFRREEAALGAGNHVDRAWALSIGDPRVRIAVLDSGINWDNDDLLNKVALNTRELPMPMGATAHDANGDGVVNVLDYLNDTRIPCGVEGQPRNQLRCRGMDGMPNDPNRNGVLDAGDLIRVFSDNRDDRPQAAAFMGRSLGAFFVWERDGRVTIPRYRAANVSGCTILYARPDLERLREEFRKLEEPHPDPERPGVYRVPVHRHHEMLFALIDAQDLPKVVGKRWNIGGGGAETQWGGARRERGKEVVLANATERQVPLKRLVLGLEGIEHKQTVVAYVNGDPLDCRRANLVIKTRSEVNLTKRKPAGRLGCAATSKYRGVGGTSSAACGRRR